MALQGDLASFALPDVLRLLAGTNKSGRLAVTGSPHLGEVWFRDGRIAGGSVTTRPSASGPSEVVYELLQFDDGSFLFDDDDQLVDGAETSDVEGALAEAEALQAEWQDVTRVVPSLDHWVSMAPEIEAEEITLDGGQWRLLAAVAGGTPVQAIAERFAVSDLEASKRVKSLAESGLIEVGEPRGAAVAADSWTQHRGDEVLADADVSDLDLDEEPQADLVHLSAEEGPVVLETSEDALLPEPLPGEGTSYSAEEDASPYNVDAPGSTLGSTEAVADDGFDINVDDPAPVADSTETVDVVSADDPALAWEALARGTGADDEIGTSEEAFRAVGWDEHPPVDHLSNGQEDDPDRSSLLKFLSSVKP